MNYGVNFGFYGSYGRPALRDSGSPLASHPSWEQVDGVAPDHFGWDGDGIVFRTRDDANRPENLRFNKYKGISGVLTGSISDPGGTENWTLPFAKFSNELNIIGARINNAKIEIVQRKNGLWTTLTSGGSVTDGSWEVTITESTIQVRVDGNLELEYSHTISGEGEFGISGHKWVHADAVQILNYMVQPYVTNPVVYNGEPVVYNGEEVIYNG
jgi:hypothetical protein